MIKVVLTSLCTLIAVTVLPLQVSVAMVNEDRAELLEFISEIDEAINRQSAESLDRLSREVSALCESSEKSLQKYACYYAGYIHYRLGTMFQQLSESQRDDHMDEAISFLEKSIGVDPEFAEAYSLKGSSYGAKISGMFSGMRYGSTAENNLEKGLELVPENPRAVMLHAISLLVKPAMFGGRTQKAIDGFKESAELFESWSPKYQLQPDWGHEEVYAWLGIAYQENEEYGRAKEAFEQALAINPDYSWVRRELMPALEEQTN